MQQAAEGAREGAGRRTVTMSAATYEVAWSHAGLGDMPIVVYVPPKGFEEWERAAVVRAAWEELERLGLARFGELTGEFADMLGLLSHARREVDARLALDRV